MPKVTFHHDGAGADVLDVAAGTNLMRAAVQNGVPGIIGECGGLPEISEDEDEMLDCTVAPRDDARSRLGCQVVVGADLDEIEVDVPASQV